MKNIIPYLFIVLASASADPFYVSPVVHSDRTVTFSVFAPGANSVSVELLNSGTTTTSSRALEKDEKGLWSVTLGPFEPEIYYYIFNTDGSKHLDYRNQRVKKWIYSSSVFQIRGDPPLMHELRKVSHGSIVSTYYDSEATGSQRSVNLYLPPGYRTDKKYPGVLLLHGWGGNNLGWIENGEILNIVDNLIAEGMIEPMILVAPDCHPFGREQVENKQANWEEYNVYMSQNTPLLAKDIREALIPFLEERFGLDTQPNQLAIMGPSTGGQLALEIGFQNVDLFAWIITLSGSLSQFDQYKDFPPFNENRAKTMEKVKLFWVEYGKTELEITPHFEKFHDWLLEHDIEHHWSTPPGGHEWDAWRIELAKILPLLFRD